jgi:hypothetical protein|tara:strand:- start:1895 stop:2926 length:1032 start_codon:yes stop_codon:yes gene_type:complete
MSTYRALHGLKIKKRSSDPSNPIRGEMWYNSTTGSIKVYGFAPASWTAGATAPGPHMTFAGCGTQTAYIKTMGNDGSPAPNPLSDSSQEYDGSSWSGAPNSPYASRDPGQAGVQTAAVFFGGQGPGGAVKYAISYNGSTFSGIPNMNHDRRSVNGTGSSTAAITVGGAGPPSGSPEGVMTNVESWNGSSWSNETATPYAVASGGSGGVESAALMVGGVSPGPEGPEAGVFTTLEYDGSSWTAGGNANTARNRSSAGLAGTQTAMLVYGGGPNKQQVESYDGSSFTSDSTLASGHNGRGNHNTTGYSTSAIYVGDPNPPGSAPGASTVEEYTAAADAVQTVAVT